MTTPTNAAAAKFTWSLAGLAALAVTLWLDDLHWAVQWEDAVPALAAIPLLWWMGRPWTLRAEPRAFSVPGASLSVTLLALGAATDQLLASALGWTGLLACTLHSFVEEDPRRPWRRLLPLAALGFPWLAFQAPWLAAWFRTSGAAAAEAMLTAMQLDVSREGTQMWTAGYCISVGGACSGVKGLQAMLIGGSVVAYQILGSSRGYWWHLPLLAAGAWAANTLRIVVTAVGIRWLPAQWMQGDSHLWQGWLLLCLMFVACLVAMRTIEGRHAEEAE